MFDVDVDDDNDDNDDDDDNDQAMNQSPGCCHCWTQTVNNWELSTKGFLSWSL